MVFPKSLWLAATFWSPDQSENLSKLIQYFLTFSPQNSITTHNFRHSGHLDICYEPKIRLLDSTKRKGKQQNISLKMITFVDYVFVLSRPHFFLVSLSLSSQCDINVRAICLSSFYFFLWAFLAFWKTPLTNLFSYFHFQNFIPRRNVQSGQSADCRNGILAPPFPRINELWNWKSRLKLCRSNTYSTTCREGLPNVKILDAVLLRLISFQEIDNYPKIPR